MRYNKITKNKHREKRKRSEYIMVKLYDGGAYLVNGTEIVPEAEAAKVEALTGKKAEKSEARKGTMSYGIMEAHNTSGNMENLKLIFREIITKITQNFRNRVPLQK
jgi:hypothetical protein